MLTPQQDHLGAASGIVTPSTCTMSDLPDELLVVVLGLLGPLEVLRMRQCCSRLYLITQDKSIWIAIAAHLTQSLPLPSLARMRGFILEELEQTTIQAVKVKKQWLATRQSQPRKINAIYTTTSGTRLILDYVQVFERRFAIVVYAAVGAVLLYDLDGLKFHGNRGDLSWGRIVANWASERPMESKSLKSRFCESTQEIVTIGLLLNSSNHFTVLSVCISGNPAEERTFRQVDITLDSTLMFSGLHPVGLSPEATYIVNHTSRQPGEIVFTNWKTGFSKSLIFHDKASHDDRYTSNNVISLEVFEPYLISVKQSHLAIYLLPPDLEDQRTSANMSTQVEVFDFQDEQFASASLARRETDAETLDIVVALSNLFGIISYYILRLPRHPYDLDTVFSFQQSLLYTDQSLAMRGVFVGSDISLGSGGVRAVWVEKSRRRMERQIRVLSIDEGVANNTGILETSVGRAYTISAVDFHNDPIHITFDEVAGRIVTATRGGDLLVFDPIGIATGPRSRVGTQSRTSRGLSVNV